MPRRKYTLAMVYDTETCNISFQEDNKTLNRAYPVLFIENDIRDRDLQFYDEKEDKIHFYRTEEEMLDRIEEYIRWGKVVGIVPIICAYNLMFDLQPLMHVLNSRYDIQVNAQSSTNVYTLDVYEEETDNQLLRFWDTFHLEMRGLDAMGKTCGLEKAVGSWNYDLIRTPETPLTDEELFYAKRDVQVIPAYLQYLLKANEWLKQEDLGVRVITKTSLVRQMARRDIGRLMMGRDEGKKVSVDKVFTDLCKKELPKTFKIYALRKACFRGGFTFTSAAYASTIQHNVVSADVTSMHHTFINGRFIPVNFSVADRDYLIYACDYILNTSREHILENYHKPFDYAIHAKIRFVNMRLKKGSCFEKYGIALLAMAKFKRELEPFSDYGLSVIAAMQENEVRDSGFCDKFDKGTFAFGKLYEGENVTLHLTELELWALSRVYEWDEMIPILGEISTRFESPPEFVTLQSNILFEQKSKAKFVTSHYEEGKPYQFNTTGLPTGIAEGLENGTLEHQFFDEWYTNTVKGQFNGIYGTQAQDVYKGDFICVNGDIMADSKSRTTESNWADKQPKTCRVLYTYGMRIVGGSRLHMVIALELLDEYFGDSIRVLGGDTDSIKASVDADVTDEELEKALEPLAKSSADAILEAQRKIREKFSNMASSLKGIGAFEIENAGHHYETHLELWNKTRISWDGKAHITAAGIARPLHKYHLGTFIDDLAKNNKIEDVMQLCMGYNKFISYDVSHALEGYRPNAKDRLNMSVTDYLGNTAYVTAHQSVALYPVNRQLGETAKISNLQNVKYLKERYGREVDTVETVLKLEDGKATVKQYGRDSYETVMEGECSEIL